jgi:hypothetical protein
MGHYEINPDDAYGIVRVVAEGEFDIALAKNMVSNARAMAARLKRPLLYDLRNISTSVSEADLYELIHTLPAFENREAGNYRAAVVLGGAIPSKLRKFYEYEASNKNIKVRGFQNSSLALDWLRGQAS